MNSSTEVFSHNNTDDIISNLHASVLTHILARLPTKDTFRTCILSKQWECKWTSSYNVQIDDCLWHNLSTGSFSDESFVNFMDKVLISTQHRLRSFRLKCEYYQDMGRLQTWISAVLRRGVERYDVNVYNRISILSCSLMNTPSLRTFKLRRTFKLQRWECILNVLTKNFLPNLTCLFLDGVHIVNVNANVRTVTFTTAQYDVLKFILKNAEQLKKFCVVGYVSRHKPEELREILSTFPKCSPYLTFEVAGRRRTTSIPKF